jgi:hypothetical protein
MNGYFYYNKDQNICAELPYVVDTLFCNGKCKTRFAALGGLMSKDEFFGWRSCEVSDTIDEKFE